MLATYEAGTLAVRGTLKAQAFIEENHAVEVAKVDAHQHYESASKSDCPAFVDAAFEDDMLSATNVWKLVQAKKGFLA